MSRGLRGFAICIFAFGVLDALLELMRCAQWATLYVCGRAEDAKKRATEEFEIQLHKMKGRSTCVCSCYRLMNWLGSARCGSFYQVAPYSALWWSSGRDIYDRHDRTNGRPKYECIGAAMVV